MEKVPINYNSHIKRNIHLCLAAIGYIAFIFYIIFFVPFSLFISFLYLVSMIVMVLLGLYIFHIAEKRIDQDINSKYYITISSESIEYSGNDSNKIIKKEDIKKIVFLTQYQTSFEIGSLHILFNDDEVIIGRNKTNFNKINELLKKYGYGNITEEQRKFFFIIPETSLR